MYTKKVHNLLTLLVLIYGTSSEEITNTNCGLENVCTPLRHCQSYLKFVDSSEKRLKPSVVGFLRRKHCGFLEGYPKVCCPDFTKKDVIVSQPGKNVNNCKKETECVLLPNCKPYMDLINSVEKPLKPAIVKFLRTQQCGFEEGYPKVCCSPLPKNFKNLKRVRIDSKPHKITDAEHDSKHIFSVTEATASVNNKRVNENIDSINEEFGTGDFFDFTGSFDLVRRKRSHKEDEIEIEIR